jgi:Mg2+ and Co2+ transporter CorA
MEKKDSTIDKKINNIKNSLTNGNFSINKLYSLKNNIFKYKITTNNKKQQLLLNNIDDYIDYKINKIQHEKTKILTIVSTIFLPLSFIVGFFGMNFKSMGVPSLTKGIFTINHSEKFILIISIISSLFILFFFYCLEYVKEY